jgi:putative sigma-54 modulation protein
MKLTISFKHLEHTPAIDEKIREKSEKFEKYFDGNVELQWTCFIQDREQVADVKLLGPNFSYHGHAKSDHLYKSIDLVIAKLEKQIVKKKSKWKEHIHHKHDDVAKEFFVNELEKDEELEQEIQENLQAG